MKRRAVLRRKLIMILCVAYFILLIPARLGWVVGVALLADLHNQMRRTVIVEREAPLCGVMCLRGFDLDVI
jgi:hypothetical protein